jgi:UDP-N-acetylmuramoylalanine-D-glutamate ligase
MSTAKKKRNKKKELVYGLGATGLSVARYLKRNDVNAIYYDSRQDAPGLDELMSLDADRSEEHTSELLSH